MPSLHQSAKSRFLKIDANTLAFQSFARYDTGSIVYQESYHKTDENGFNYMLPEVTHNYNGANLDMRLIKTDPVLYTCGAKYFNLNDQMFNPIAVDYQYVVDSDTVSTYFNYNYQQPFLSYNDCNDSNADMYKSGATNVFNTNAVMGIATSVYPTMLHDQNETVHCVINSQRAGVVTLTVTDMLGRKAYQKQEKLMSGQNSFDINTNFSPGLNSVGIDINGKRVDIKKIVVQL